MRILFMAVTLLLPMSAWVQAATVTPTRDGTISQLLLPGGIALGDATVDFTDTNLRVFLNANLFFLTDVTSLLEFDLSGFSPERTLTDVQLVATSVPGVGARQGSDLAGVLDLVDLISVASFDVTDIFAGSNRPRNVAAQDESRGLAGQEIRFALNPDALQLGSDDPFLLALRPRPADQNPNIAFASLENSQLPPARLELTFADALAPVPVPAGLSFGFAGLAALAVARSCNRRRVRKSVANKPLG